MAKGKKTGGGSRKGVPNKTTATVRENVLAVFDQIGGQEHMAQWATDNPNEFYKLYGRMAPSDPDAPGGKDNPLQAKVTVEFIRSVAGRIRVPVGQDG